MPLPHSRKKKTKTSGLFSEKHKDRFLKSGRHGVELKMGVGGVVLYPKQVDEIKVSMQIISLSGSQNTGTQTYTLQEGHWKKLLGALTKLRRIHLKLSDIAFIGF